MCIFFYALSNIQFFFTTITEIGTKEYKQNYNLIGEQQADQFAKESKDPKTNANSDTNLEPG